MTLAQILARLVELRTQIETLATIEGELTDEQRSDWDTLNAEWDTLDEQRAVLEERNARVERIRNANLAAETGDGATARGPSEPSGGPTLIRNMPDAELYDLRHVGRYGRDEREVGAELRDRALAAIERAPSYMDDDSRAHAARLVEGAGHRTPPGAVNHSARIAEHIIRTGSPEYHEAFHEYLASQGTQRAAMSLTGANGGFLVPFTLDPTIILTNTGSTNPFRQISRTVTITTDDWNGVSSAGVTAEWLAEGVEAADATPTFVQPSITVHKAAAWLFGSYEMLADSGFDGTEVARLIRDAKDRLEATAMATGSGSGQPYGIVTALGLTTASRVAGSSGAAGAADFVVGDVYALQNNLPPRWRPGSSWVAEQTTLNRIRQFATGSGPQHAFWADLAVDTPSLLLGRPVYESSAMDSTIVSGSNDDILILGDFGQGFVIVDRVGLEIMYEPLIKGSNQRPTGQAGWFAFWRVGADSVADDAFRMLRV